MNRLEQILECNERKWQEHPYLFEKVAGEWKGKTYGDFLEDVRGLAGWLVSLGLLGKPVLLYGENSRLLMTADLALLHYVGISVCVSKEWKEKDLLRAVKQLEISYILYGEEKQAVIDRVKEKLPSLTCICLSSVQKVPGQWEPRKEEECCKIVFSSGTTAHPKAVMLSEKNIFAGLDSLYRRCPFDEKDVDYLFLPLSHTYGGIYNFLYSLVFGFRIYLCSGIRGMEQEILEVNPTLFCGVPAIYRRFYEHYGQRIGTAFGSRIAYLFCGGAYFDEDIRKAYKESGLNMMEAYGLSETASTFAIQYPQDPDTRSVGTIAEDIKVKVLSPDACGIGEIAVKGDNVFLGYAGDEELTDSVFTGDGYFRTGDLGYLEADERNGGKKLYLTGRIKKVLLGENGENVEPIHIEHIICGRDANISKALVYMENSKLGCHIYLKEPENRDWEAFFAGLNAELPGYERIGQYDIAVDSVEKRLKQ